MRCALWDSSLPAERKLEVERMEKEKEATQDLKEAAAEGHHLADELRAVGAVDGAMGRKLNVRRSRMSRSRRCMVLDWP